ncbi:MAG: HEAT repeat domain-containing protein, partial [bacterium]
NIMINSHKIILSCSTCIMCLFCGAVSLLCSAEKKPMPQEVLKQIQVLGDTASAKRKDAALVLGEIYRKNTKEKDTEAINEHIRSSILKYVHDPDKEVRRTVIQSLRNMKHPDTFRQLRQALIQEDDPRVQIVLIRTVGELQDTGAEEMLMPYITHDQIPIRIAGITALGNLGTETAYQVVINSLQSRFEGIQIIAANICADKGLTESLDLLIVNSTHPTAGVRVSAINAIGILGTHKVIRTLNNLQKKEKDPAVRDTIDTAISQIRLRK